MASRKAYLARNLEDVDITGVIDNDSLVWDSGDEKWKPVAISGGGGGGGGHTIQDEGVAQTQRTNLNFVGSAVSVLDDLVNDATKITIGLVSGILTQEVYETLTAQVVSGISHFSLSDELTDDSLRVYYNGIRQQSNYFVVDSDNLGFTTAFIVEVGDEIFVDYEITTSGIGLLDAYFTSLLDTPNTYSGDASKFVKVNAIPDALEFVDVTIPASFIDLDDVPANYAAASGLYVRVNDTEDALIFEAVSADPIALDDLTDVTILNPTSEQMLYYNTVSGWTNEFVPLDYIGDVTITDPQESQFLQYNSATGKWINHSALVTQNLYLHDVASDIGGYNKLLANPPEGAEVLDSVNVAAASGIMLIDSYITDDELGTTVLQGGSWHFITWAKVDNVSGDSIIITKVYEREDGGAENLIFTVTSDDINSTSLKLVEADIFIPDTIVASNSRLVFKYYAQTTSIASRLVSIAHDGLVHYTHAHLPFTVGSTGATPTAFTDLTDVPSSYAGEGEKFVKVNVAEDALEFVAGGGGGGAAVLSAFRAKLSGDWNPGTTNSFVKVAFNTAEWNFGGHYDPTTNYRWTPPSGIITIKVLTYWTNVNANHCWTDIYKNGAAVAMGYTDRYPDSVQVYYDDIANGADYYEVYGQRGSFSSAIITAGTGVIFSGTCLTDA